MVGRGVGNKKPKGGTFSKKKMRRKRK